MPTPERNSSSVAVRVGREVALLDCGEGTQRQMVAAHIGFNRVKNIFISHLHGDHVLGLPGLIQSMGLQRRDEILNIYGPRGIQNFIDCISKTLGDPIFPVNVQELHKSGIICDQRSYFIEAVNSDHSIEGWSYSLSEKMKPGRFHPENAIKLGIPKGILWKQLQDGNDIFFDGKIIKSIEVVDPPRSGRKIVYSGDTRPNDALIELSTSVSLLIHEATFDDDLMDRAAEDGHSTFTQAARIAKIASVKRLIITHISSRYSDPSLILRVVKGIFEKADIAYDLLEIIVPPT